MADNTKEEIKEFIKDIVTEHDSRIAQKFLTKTELSQIIKDYQAGVVIINEEDIKLDTGLRFTEDFENQGGDAVEGVVGRVPFRYDGDGDIYVSHFITEPDDKDSINAIRLAYTRIIADDDLYDLYWLYIYAPLADNVAGRIRTTETNTHEAGELPFGFYAY